MLRNCVAKAFYFACVLSTQQVFAAKRCVTTDLCVKGLPELCGNTNNPFKYGFHNIKTNAASISVADPAGTALALTFHDTKLDQFGIRHFGSNGKERTVLVEKGYRPVYGMHLGNDVVIAGLTPSKSESDKLVIIDFSKSTLAPVEVEMDVNLKAFIAGQRVDDNKFYVHAWYKDPRDTSDENVTGTKIFVIEIATGKIFRETTEKTGHFGISSAVSGDKILAFGYFDIVHFDKTTLKEIKRTAYGGESGFSHFPLGALALLNGKVVFADHKGVWGVWKESEGIVPQNDQDRIAGKGMVLVPVNNNTYLSFSPVGNLMSQSTFMVHNVRNTTLVNNMVHNTTLGNKESYRTLGDSPLIDVRPTPDGKLIALDQKAAVHVWERRKAEPVKKTQLTPKDDQQTTPLRGLGMFFMDGKLFVVTSDGTHAVPRDVWK